MDDFGCNNVYAPNSFAEVYRLFLNDPVQFNSHIKVTATAGDSAIATVTNNVTYTVDNLYFTQS